MFYEFECRACNTKAEQEFRMGKAPKSVKCGRCGGQAKRIFSTFALSIGGAINRKSTFGESMRNLNQKAAHRMKGRERPARITAYDYGNGDIRGI